MDAQRWQVIEALYHRALERDADRRDAFLREACGSDHDLLGEVRSLLAHGAEADRFMELPALEAAGQALASDGMRLGERPSLVGQTIAHYRVLEKIGAGGMGEVYRAHDTKLGREVAIKALPAEFANDADRVLRLEREARVLASLNHPSIAAIYGIEEYEGSRFLILELVEGDTLSDRLKRGALPIDESLSLALQIAQALEAAHDRGVIHRDLKPSNIKVTDDGRVKVLDFGLAKATPFDDMDVRPSDSHARTTDATQTGDVLGTAAYMSPEQARADAADRRADVWAFGCVLYEILTGRRLFVGDSTEAVIHAVLHAEYELHQLPPEVPASVRRLLRRCLVKDRKNRLQHMGDARLELADLSDPPVAPERIPSTAIAVAWSSNRQWWLAIPGLIMMGFLLANVADLGSLWDIPGEQLVLPVNTPPTLNPESFALAPDGTKMVLMGFDEAGVHRLWLQQLDSAQARPLDGTEGARYPFWSPDSRSVGFFADARLKRIDLESGRVRDLAPARIGSGGTWNDDDVIVFARAYDSHLVRVPADGGESIPATTLLSQGGHLFPSFLPDGRHFLYYKQGDASTRGIYIAELLPPPESPLPVDLTEVSSVEGSEASLSSLEDGTLRSAIEQSRDSWRAYDENLAEKQRFLTSSDDGAAYAPSGHMLWVRDGILLAQRFAVDRLELAGPEFVVAEQVLVRPSISTGGTILYRSGVQVRDEGQLRWFDRRGSIIETVGMPFGFRASGLSMSTDARFASIAGFVSGRLHTWVVNLVGGDPRRLTFGDVGGNFQLVSPDGTEVVYMERTSLYRQFLSSGGRSLLAAVDSIPIDVDSGSSRTQDDDAFFPADWSPDGTSMFFTANLRTSAILLYRFDEPVEEGVNPSFVENTLGFSPVFSPIGNWMAFASDAYADQYEIFLQQYPNGGGRDQISSGGGGQPRWRADGRELFYVSSDGYLMAVPIRVSNSGETLEAGVPVRLFQTDMPTAGSSLHYYAPSSDGQRFLIHTQPLPEDLKTEPLTFLVNWRPDETE